MKKLASIGKIDGSGNKWKAFKEWLETVRANGGSPEGVYPITHLLLPNRYPQATVVFWVESDDVGVKRAVQPSEWNVILQALGATPGKPIKGYALWLQIAGDEVEVLLDESASTVYVPTNYGWEMV